MNQAPQIAKLLLTLMFKGAAEMRLKVGSAPVLRLEDRECELQTKSLEQEDLERYVNQITTSDVRATCEMQGRSEFGIRFSADGRRCNIGVVLRKGGDGYELVFRMIGPIERERTPANGSELSDDVN